jgi:hypothetical protein
MASYEADDLSQREFCKKHAVPYSSFCYWRKQLSLEARPNTAALVELPASLAEQLTSERSSSENSQWRVELTLGSGTILRIR